MSPTFRLRPARSRPRGRSRRAPRAGLLAVLTGVLVLLAATGANAATVVEGWGSSERSGEALGLQETGTSLAPTPLPVPEGASAAALGVYSYVYGNAFVLTPSGVFSAGSGYLGFGGEELGAPFKLIPGTAGAKAVAAGATGTVILQDDGTVLGFGPSQPTPTPIAGLSDVTAIASGGEFSLALEASGSVWSWGSTPTQVALPEKATAIAAGYGQGLALLEDGSVWAWGENESGQVGNGQAGGPVATPVQVIAPPASPGAPSVTAITAGEESSYALFSDGSFEAWGDNEGGALGLGNGGAGELPDERIGVDTPTAPTEHYEPLTQISAIGGTAYAIATSYEGVTRPVLILGETIQREGRLQGVSWLGVGSTGLADIAADTPTLQPEHSDLPFYTQALGTVSAPEGIEVDSNDESTSVSHMQITGPDAGDFEIVGQNVGGFTSLQLKPGISESLPLTIGDLHVYIRFIPSGLGERLATLEVEGEGEKASIQLAGYATEPPGNTPGPEGAPGTGTNGNNGNNGVGVPGPAGPAGPAGKNGVVVFAAAASKASVKPGHVATLHFGLGNGTTGGFPKTSLSVSAPKGLHLRGSKTATVASLGAGKSLTVTLRLKVGAKARRGTYEVEVSWKLGGKTVTRTVQVRVL
jgi:Regulator of chromosome condensation (RCC1) repeat/NPCBM-associated, NEW3 domain of alpha-galactosidase